MSFESSKVLVSSIDTRWSTMILEEEIPALTYNVEFWTGNEFIKRILESSDLTSMIVSKSV